MTVSVEELSRFLAAPPPRSIPESIRIARLPRARLGFGLAFGFAVIALSVPIVLHIFPDRILDDWRLDLGTVQIADGTVTAVADTDIETSGPQPGDLSPVRRIEFEFVVPAGTPQIGRSHAAIPTWPVGDSVTVEYLPDEPTLARIRGTTLSRTPRIGVAVLLFPAFGGLWTWLLLRRRAHVRSLLRDGTFATAGIVQIEMIHASMSGRRRERVTIAWQHDGVVHSVAAVPTQGEAELIRRRQAAGLGLGILFDPHDPTRYFLADSMIAPGRDEESRPARA